MYAITLSDGSKLENLTLNGNNFITAQEITEATFRRKLSHVNIECDDDGYNTLRRDNPCMRKSRSTTRAEFGTKNALKMQL